MARYFIYAVNVTSTAHKMERELAEVVRPYERHILSERAMESLEQMARVRQIDLHLANKRLRPVTISLDLHPSPDYIPPSFAMGNVFVTFYKVEGEVEDIVIGEE